MNETPSEERERSADQDEITWRSVWEMLELGCCSAIVLMPVLYWISGPAVSTDQFIIRLILIVLAVTGGVCSVTYRIVQRSRD